VRRLTGGLVAFLALVGTLIILPVLTSSIPAPRPVPTKIDELALGSVTAPEAGASVTSPTASPGSPPPGTAAPGTPAPATTTDAPSATAGSAAGPGLPLSGHETAGVPALTLTRESTGEFESVGVTWRPDDAVGRVQARIRVKDLHGAWSEWTTLENDDVVQRVSAETADNDVRDGTAPYWTGPAKGVQVVVQTTGGSDPQDVRLALLDPGSSPADSLPEAAAPTSTAHAAGTMPRVYTRAEWGADESIRTWDPEYPSTIKAATIHHTADSNDYTAAQVPAILRAMYAYHAQTRGWGDIGYNVIVDKFGRIFEGRYGGLASTVVGAHAGGFNTFTFGVSMLGNYDIAPVPQATINAVAEIVAWKLSLYGVDPRGTTVLTSGGGGTAKYAAGTRVTLPTIFAHRDVGSTVCPGQYGYARMGEIRDRVNALVGAVGRTLLRTPESPAVYVVSGTSKYLIQDLATLDALSPLGPVGYVAQSYLDKFATVSRQGRVVLAPSGAVYFIDAGIKLPFGSCTQVADYGADCASLVRWEQPLIDAFVNGPPITPVYRTTSGKTFYVAGGIKREAVDDTALTQAGLPTSGVRLLETGLADLPYGAPITRDGVVIKNRGTGAVTVSAGGQFTTVSEAVRAATALSQLPVRSLDAASAAGLPRTDALGVFVKEAVGTRVFLLTERGKVEVTSPAALPASVPTMNAATLALFPDAGTLGSGSFLTGSSSGAVYALAAGVRRPARSWADLVALDGGADPSAAIVTIDQSLIDLLPAGPAQLGPGSLVHSPRSGAVYFVNNLAELIPVGSFNTTNELGATRLVAVADADIDAYTIRPDGLSNAIACGANQSLGLGGQLHAASATVAAQYPPAYTTVDPLACASLRTSTVALDRFLRADSGAIYYMENGLKRPIRSYPGYLTLGGTAANTIQASDFALAQIPTGPAI
jgi:hypothetical protein